MVNVNLSTTTLSTESVLNIAIELEKKKERNIENKNKPLEEKIAKENERITELEKNEKERDQKIKEIKKERDQKIKEYESYLMLSDQKIKKLQSENKAIAGFTNFFLSSKKILNFDNF